MRGWSPDLFLVALVVLAVAGGAVSGLFLGAAAGTDGGQSAVPLQGGEVDQVVMEVAIQPDGSAAWRIEHRIRLDDDAATQGFAETQSRVETDPEAFRANFTERVRTMATTAEAATGRTMVVENVSVSAQREQLPREYGIVVYEFDWYGFAETGDRLRAGDALAGLFLDEATTLLVSWPDNVTLGDVSPEPDERRETAVVWDGPLEFATGEPVVVLESESLSFGPDIVWGVSGNDTLVTLGVAVFALLGLVGTGGLALRRRHSGDTDGSAEGGEPAGDGTDSGRIDGTSAGDATDGEAGPDEGVAATGSGETEEGDGDSTPPDTEVPEELLSNEERVLALMEEQGGRVKQQDVVGALGWSETKTSEVVSKLRESERIEVYRIGRSNVLALPETGLGYESEGDESDEPGGEQR